MIEDLEIPETDVPECTEEQWERFLAELKQNVLFPEVL